MPTEIRGIRKFPPLGAQSAQPDALGVLSGPTTDPRVKPEAKIQHAADLPPMDQRTIANRRGFDEIRMPDGEVAEVKPALGDAPPSPADIRSVAKGLRGLARLKLTKPERQFFDSTLGNAAEREELVEAVPSLQNYGSHLEMALDDIDRFMEYVRETVRLSRKSGGGGGASTYPKSFANDAKLQDRLQFTQPSGQAAYDDAVRSGMPEDLARRAHLDDVKEIVDVEDVVVQSKALRADKFEAVRENAGMQGYTNMADYLNDQMRKVGKRTPTDGRSAENLELENPAYILSDGTLIGNTAGGHELMAASVFPRSVSSVTPDRKLAQFFIEETGAIRTRPSGGELNFQFVKPPTPAQRKSLARLVEDSSATIVIDTPKGSETVLTRMDLNRVLRTLE